MRRIRELPRRDGRLGQNGTKGGRIGTALALIAGVLGLVSCSGQRALDADHNEFGTPLDSVSEQKSLFEPRGDLSLDQVTAPAAEPVDDLTAEPVDDLTVEPVDDLTVEPVDDLDGQSGEAPRRTSSRDGVVWSPPERRSDRLAPARSESEPSDAATSRSSQEDGTQTARTPGARPLLGSEASRPIRRRELPGWLPPRPEEPEIEYRTTESKLKPRRPAGDMARSDFGDDCTRSGCHAGLKDAPVAHGPVVVDECGVCHEATGPAQNHDFRLVRQGAELCQWCHEAPDAQHVVHAPFGEGNCVSCHDPHGSTSRGLLLAENAAALCRSCHVIEDREIAHGPYSVGECLLCHEAHQSQNEKLLTRPPGKLCAGCHTRMAEHLAASTFVHGPAAVDCGVCHLPHTASNRSFLRTQLPWLCLDCHDSVTEKAMSDPWVHGALNAEKSCIGCHAPHASQYGSLLVGVTVKLCLSCHDRTIVNESSGKKIPNMREVLAAKYRHGPINNGDCQACHFPHSSTHANLLHEAYPESFYHSFDSDDYALCFKCHEKSLVESERTTTLTNFRDGDRNLHYLHVNRERGRTCRACHEVHASENPFQIRNSVPFGRMNWQLPINFERNPRGGGCAPGCHKAVRYDNGASRVSSELEDSTRPERRGGLGSRDTSKPRSSEDTP